MKKKNIKSFLVKVDDIIKLINLVLISGKIKGERPLSAILISNIETGKSEILSHFMDFNGVIWANDLSRKILFDSIVPEVEKGSKTHIVCPDFLNYLAHHKDTVKGTMMGLNAFIEEGLKDIRFYGTERHYSKVVIGGIVFAITKEEYNFRKKYWKNIGFLSRCIPITYSYSKDTIYEIHNYISNGFKSKKITLVVPPKRQVNIKFTSKSEQELVKMIALGKKKRYETGFRLHKHLRTLAKCIAYYNGSRKVNIADIDEMRRLLDYINFDYKEI
ncbi:MAG: hypothetical protein ACE5KE_00200 [Methanosarcinales archaeon]